MLRPVGGSFTWIIKKMDQRSTKNSKFGELFKIGQIGKLKTKNRLVMPPMLTAFALKDGYVTKRMIDYYERRAKGGVGLIIVETTFVHPDGQTYERQLSISDERYISGLSQLARSIKRHGTRVAIQLNHGGCKANSEIIGKKPFSPSPIPYKENSITKELTINEIKKIINLFSSAAKRCMESGFDAIEISGTTGGILGQFISRAYNKRRDIYGGDIRNRTRLLENVLIAIREVVGGDYPIWCRLNGKEEDGIKNGITIEEASEIAKIAQAAGAQAIHLYVGSSGSPINLIKRPITRACFVYLAEKFKNCLSIPVIAVGSIDVNVGEKILSQKKADFIAMGKSLIADPDIPIKAAENREKDIIPCIACMHCVDEVVYRAKPLECSVNPQAGRESEYNMEKAETPKKVIIIGGGPAGLQAAITAAKRGHHITLYEKSMNLGGQLLLATLLPKNEKIASLIDYQRTQVDKLGIEVKLGETVKTRLIIQVQPSILILATGAKWIIPNIAGVKRNNVIGASNILSGMEPTGTKIIIIGGGMVGCEIAEVIANSKVESQVTIVEMQNEIAKDIGPTLQPSVLARLKHAGVLVKTGYKVFKIDKKGVLAQGKNTEFFEADTIVLAVGMKSNKGMLSQCLGLSKTRLYLIGDAMKPRRIVGAIADGFRIGLEI
jgi:2,4-dienoyl-CoA reductase-like NADH-dependent reductase (Old Yellow Enzyme family)/thioredoxin reductase